MERSIQNYSYCLRNFLFLKYISTLGTNTKKNHRYELKAPSTLAKHRCSLLMEVSVIACVFNCLGKGLSFAVSFSYMAEQLGFLEFLNFL